MIAANIDNQLLFQLFSLSFPNRSRKNNSSHDLGLPAFLHCFPFLLFHLKNSHAKSVFSSPLSHQDCGLLTVFSGCPESTESPTLKYGKRVYRPLLSHESISLQQLLVVLRLTGATTWRWTIPAAVKIWIARLLETSVAAVVLSQCQSSISCIHHVEPEAAVDWMEWMHF